MYQNYNTYYPQMPVRTNTQQTTIIPPPQMMLKGRPVSSLEEARATGIDFDGSIFYFPDLANRRIYTKQINMDGTATLNMYEFKEIPTAPTSSMNFVTREEFEEALRKIQAGLMNPVVTSDPANSIPAQETPTYSF